MPTLAEVIHQMVEDHTVAGVLRAIARDCEARGAGFAADPKLAGIMRMWGRRADIVNKAADRIEGRRLT